MGGGDLLVNNFLFQILDDSHYIFRRQGNNFQSITEMACQWGGHGVSHGYLQVVLEDQENQARHPFLCLPETHMQHSQKGNKTK